MTESNQENLSLYTQGQPHLRRQIFQVPYKGDKQESLKQSEPSI